MQLSRLVPQQLPGFVRAEYPAFVEFMQAYYDWLETTNFANSLTKLTDIDTTVDSYMEYFEKEYDIFGIQRNIATGLNKRQFIKRVRDLYASKGSNASIEFIFKVLYDKEVIIKNPWDETLRVSEGHWTQDTTLLVSAVAGDILTMSGDIVNIRNETGNVYRTHVRAVTERAGGLYELFIDRIADYRGPFVQVDMDNKAVVGKIVPTITKGKVAQRGRSFRPGQLFQLQSPNRSNVITSIVFRLNAGVTLSTLQLNGLRKQLVDVYDINGTKQVATIKEAAVVAGGYRITLVPLQYKGSKLAYISGSTYDISGSIDDFVVEEFGGSDSLFKIKSVDEYGGITGLEIVKFGSGYLSNFAVAILANGEDPNITSKIDFTHNVPTTHGLVQAGIHETSYPTDDKLTTSLETINIVRHNYTLVPTPQLVGGQDQSYVSLDYVGDTLANFAITNQITGNNKDVAIIHFYLGEVCVYPGNYTSSASILGDLAYIHDSYRYQAFSYVTSVDEPFRKYADLLKNIIHVAGTKLLGEYSVNNDLSLDLIIEPSLNFIRQRDALYSYITSAVDMFLDITKVLDDTSSTEDGVLYYHLLRTLYSTNAPNGIRDGDDDTYYMIKKLSASMLVSVSSFFKDVIKKLSDTYTTTDTNLTYLMQKKATTDFVATNALTLTKAVIKVLSGVDETVDTTDTVLDYVLQKKMPTDYIVASTADNIRRALSRSISGQDSIVAADTGYPLKDPNKYFTEPIDIQDVGVVYQSPIYTEINPSYWLPGYLDSERVFLN